MLAEDRLIADYGREIQLGIENAGKGKGVSGKGKGVRVGLP